MRMLPVVVLCLWVMSAAIQAQTSPDRPADEAVSVSPPNARPVVAAPKHTGGIHWGPLVRQWWLFIAIEHTERILKEPKTREQLSGPFFHDWFNTVSMYRFDRWDDDDKFITSYLGHPTQGAIVAAIFWQNNDHVRFSDQDFHSKAYRHALLQTFAFVTVDAVQWKLGPLSEASIGNVGLPMHWWDRDCKEIHIPCVPRTGMNDLVLNEVGGLAMTIGYQWVDKHLQKGLVEQHVHNRAVIDATRVLTNPPQAVANIFRSRAPWFRDNRQ